MGTLIDSTFENHVGETCRILLDKSGYSGTTYTDDDGTAEATEWRIGRGAPDTTYRIVRQNTNATIGLLVKSSALVNELETVYASDRTFKLTLIRAGTTRFEGWLQSSFVRTQQEPDQPAVIELRGKPQAQMPEASSLEALRDDWVDSNGDRFTGTKTYGPTIASILQRTGLAYDLEAVIHWRPDSMSASDDPLSVQFDTDAFYREGDDGELRVMSAGAVLDDLLGTFNAWVLLREGPVWRIVQSEAFVNGSSVDRWEYDSNGLLKSGQPVSESAVVDISTDVRESDKGDPSKSGLDPIADTRITYEFGPRVGTIDFGGDMENLSSEWKFFDNGTENTLANHPTIEEQTQSAFVRSGSASMRIEGTEVAGGTDPDNFTSAVEDWAQVQITKGSIEPSVKDLQVTLRAIPEVVDDDSDPSTVPNEARAFWGLRFLPLDSAKENQWWILPPNPSGVLGWKKKSNLSQGEKYNFLEDQNFDGGNFIEGRFPIDSVPSTGTLELRLYNPVSEPGTGYTLHANWDDAEFSRNTGSAPKLTSRFQNQSISTGETAERTHRVGTGPRDDSIGGLLDNQGSIAENWSVIGESQNRTIQGLSNLRLIRLRELPRETWEPTVVQPSTEPVPGKAIVDGSTRYWPLLVESLQPDNAFHLKLAELTLGASTLDEKTVDGASVSDVETERVVSTLTGLNDTQISSLQDGKAVQYDSGEGAFVLGESGGVQLVTLDASGGNVTEQLPDPSTADAAVALRTDTSSNTATIEDPNGNDIIWPGNTNTASIDLEKEQSLYFVSDGAQWYVERGFDIFGTISSYAPGLVTAGKTVFQRTERQSVYLEDLVMKAETAPTQTGGVGFEVRIGGNQVATFSLTSSQTTVTIGVIAQAGDEVLVQSTDSSRADDAADISCSFKASTA